MTLFTPFDKLADEVRAYAAEHDQCVLLVDPDGKPQLISNVPKFQPFSDWMVGRFTSNSLRAEIVEAILFDLSRMARGRK